MKCHREGFIVFITHFLGVLFFSELFGKCLVECPTQLVHHLITLWVWRTELLTQLVGNPRINFSLNSFVWQYKFVFLSGRLDLGDQLFL